MPPPYREIAPDPRLSRAIECGWSISSETPIRNYPVRPDGCIDLIFSPVNGLSIVGTMTSERRFDLPAGARTAGIRFRPGMAGSFLRVPAAELTDRSVPAQELLPARAAARVKEAESRLAAARSAEECMRIMTALIGAPLHPPNPVQRAIEAIAANPASAGLDRVANRTGLSVRQFRRRCLEESGLSPKRLMRILRFRLALDLAARTAHPHAARIALDAGYFDQAHMTRDFHEFAHATPLAVFSNTRP